MIQDGRVHDCINFFQDLILLILPDSIYQTGRKECSKNEVNIMRMQSLAQYYNDRSNY